MVKTVITASPHDQDFQRVMVEAFTGTRRDLGMYAEATRHDLSDLHCTLLGILLQRSTGRFVTGRVGDGLIVGLDAAQTPKELAKFSMQGDVGETVFLTQKGWDQAQRCAVGSAHEYRSLCLMTDGLAEDILYPPPADVLARALRDIDRQVRLDASIDEIAAGFLRWLSSYEKPDSRDDRTLVVIWQTNPTEAQE
jgi:hypothetical protein